MAVQSVRAKRQYPCEKCPLRPRSIFRDFTRRELEYVSDFKKGELSVDRGATLLNEGSRNPHLYTVLSGWAFRYKLLSDGRRQIVNYAMPGDMIGLQGSLMGEMQHSVEALSPMLLCVFERSELHDLFREFPDLGYDITWIAAREECILDENLLSIGRRTAIERVAYLLSHIVSRAESTGLDRPNGAQIPLTQQHIADTLGLSLVHTNKTIRKLINRKVVSWREGGCTILDEEALHALGGWSEEKGPPRPLI